MSPRTRDERGFTLVELLVAMTISTIILLAAFNLLDASFRGQRTAENRLDAGAQARLVMDRLTRQLRSQICLGKGIAPILSATDTKIDFYASLAPPNNTNPSEKPKVQRRTLEYIPTTGGRGKVVQTVQTAGGSLPNLSWNTPVVTETLATDVAAVPGVPFFRYWKYDPDQAPNVQPVTPPISEANRQIIIQVQTAFLSYPVNTFNADDVKVRMDSKVTVRTADPTDPTRSPKCI